MTTAQITYAETITRHGAPLLLRSYENGRGCIVYVNGEAVGSIDRGSWSGYAPLLWSHRYAPLPTMADAVAFVLRECGAPEPSDLAVSGDVKDVPASVAQAVKVPSSSDVQDSAPAIGSRVTTPDGSGIVVDVKGDVMRVRLDSSAPSHPGYCYPAADVSDCPICGGTGETVEVEPVGDGTVSHVIPCPRPQCARKTAPRPSFDDVMRASDSDGRFGVTIDRNGVGTLAGSTRVLLAAGVRMGTINGDTGVQHGPDVRLAGLDWRARFLPTGRGELIGPGSLTYLDAWRELGRTECEACGKPRGSDPDFCPVCLALMAVGRVVDHVRASGASPRARRIMFDRIPRDAVPALIAELERLEASGQLAPFRLAPHDRAPDGGWTGVGRYWVDLEPEPVVDGSPRQRAWTGTLGTPARALTSVNHGAVSVVVSRVLDACGFWEAYGLPSLPTATDCGPIDLASLGTAQARVESALEELTSGLGIETELNIVNGRAVLTLRASSDSDDASTFLVAETGDDASDEPIIDSVPYAQAVEALKGRAAELEAEGWTIEHGWASDGNYLAARATMRDSSRMLAIEREDV